MKKFALVGTISIVLFLVYKVFFSIKIELTSAMNDYNKYYRSANSKSISFVIKNSEELQSFTSHYCSIFPKNSINSVIVEELSLLPIDSDTIIKSFIEKSPPLTYQTEYSQEFKIFYKLSRLFPDSSQQVYQEIIENSEHKEFTRQLAEWGGSFGKNAEVTEEAKENALKYFSFVNCVTAKVALGLIGKDEDFDRSMNLIQDEIVVRNSRQAKKALEEIRAVLKQQD